MKVRFAFIVSGIICAIAPLFWGVSFLPYHIAAAVSSYVFFVLCIVVCLAARTGKIDVRRAILSCDAGLFFAIETLLTGAFWAHRAWGSAWVWEPRLTGMLLTTFFFASWRIACFLMGETAAAKPRLTASLIVLGLPAMAFTHLSVRLFGGIHPDSVAHSGASFHLVPVLCAVIAHLLIGVAIYLSPLSPPRAGGKPPTAR